jgi:small conductance mechanosensitive channel
MKSTTTAVWLASLGAVLWVAALPSAIAAEDPADTDVASSIARVQERRVELQAALAEASGRRQLLLEDELRQFRLETQQLLATIATELAARRDADEDISKSIALLTHTLSGAWPGFIVELEAREAAVQALDAADGAAGEFELWEERQRLHDTYQALVGTIVTLAPLGIEVEDYRVVATEKLDAWARDLLAEARIAARHHQFAAARASATPENAERQAALRLADDRLGVATGRLGSAVALMEQLDVPSERYQEALIAITGEISSRVLDANVAMSLLRRLSGHLIDSFTSGVPGWLFKLFVFVLILSVFRMASSLTRRVVERSINASNLKLSQLLKETVISWSARGVMLVGLLVAIAQLGVEIGALVAGLGIAGFVLGFALQDTLSNFAAGAMILIYRPFDVGDLIESAGARGIVRKMTLVSTTIITVDNQTLIIPNTKIWGDVILNVTAQQIRRVDLLFGASYSDDIDHVEDVLREIVSKNEGTLDHPEPDIHLHQLGDSSINFIVALR